MAISTYVQTAIQICVLTAFSLVPRNVLIRKCCLIHLKNSSTCQRCRYKSAINVGSSAKLLVKNVMRFPLSSLTTRSEEHTSELQSLMRTSYAVFCWKKKINK